MHGSVGRQVALETEGFLNGIPNSSVHPFFAHLHTYPFQSLVQEYPDEATSTEIRQPNTTFPFVFASSRMRQRRS